MSLIEIATVLVVLAAVFGWLNRVTIRLPHTIGLLVFGIVFSLAVVLYDRLLPGDTVVHDLYLTLRNIDFFDTLMNGMLSFLLFAAALHVDIGILRQQRWAIALLATLGILISSVIVGAGAWGIAQLVGVDLPIAWAFVFGVLISPTDPVAVLSVMKRVHVAPALEGKIAGESLFNDGVGVVAFTVVLAIAAATVGVSEGGHGLVHGDGVLDWPAIGQLFAVEVFGAILLGIVGGLIVLAMTWRVDDAEVETLISIALVLGVYVGGMAMHMSGPIAAVVAGLILGNWGPGRTLSQRTRDHMFPFWTMLDELLNAVLFLLVGLEIVALDFDVSDLLIALACIPLVLVARFIAVAVPINGLRILRQRFTTGTVRLMTWGGVRGGISVALALSLPEVPYKDLILHMTYVVVIFSVVVQGLTIAPLIRSIAKGEEAKAAAGEKATRVIV